MKKAARLGGFFHFIVLSSPEIALQQIVTKNGKKRERVR